MTLRPARWLSLSFFTYFFSYGIYLPFGSLWLEGEGISSQSIGILLGIGLAARFLGNIFITPTVKNPSYLVTALRILALLTLLCAVGFLFGTSWLWLAMVIIGFNLFFGPMIPLSDALAGTWQRQIQMDYGRVRLWGSLAFIVGTSITGVMVNAFGHQAIIYSLLAGIVFMLLGLLQRPSVMPIGHVNDENGQATPWRELLTEPNVWRFLVCVTLLQGAHAAYYVFSSIYWKAEGYSASAVGNLWSVGVVAEILVFAFSYRLFHRWHVRDLLILVIISSLIRWSLMASTTALPWLVLAQALHSGTFAVCHLAAIKFISARSGADVIRLQGVYSALATGGGIALMTSISGFLYERFQGGAFWAMALVVLPTILLLPKTLERKALLAE